MSGKDLHPVGHGTGRAGGSRTPFPVARQPEAGDRAGSGKGES